MRKEVADLEKQVTEARMRMYPYKEKKAAFPAYTSTSKPELMAITS